jgi:hypothetical protein
MDNVSVARRPLTIPMVFLLLAFAAAALLLETQLSLGLRLPGHRAFPGGLALAAIAGAVSPVVLVGFAAVVGALIAALSGHALFACAWLLPAALLAITRARTQLAQIALGLTAGLSFGLLRYLALFEAPHHTPASVRLAGHLAFGALGAAVGLGLRRLTTR